jgi:hypothetical protein
MCCLPLCRNRYELLSEDTRMYNRISKHIRMAKRIPNGEQYYLRFTAALYFVQRMKANKQTAWNIWFTNVLNAKVTYMAAHCYDQQPISPPPQLSLDTICKLVCLLLLVQKLNCLTLALFTFVNTALCSTLCRLQIVSRLSIGWMVHQICHLIQWTSEKRLVRPSLPKAYVTLNFFSWGL